MARPKRFELLTPKFVVWCSIQLSYGRVSPPEIELSVEARFKQAAQKKRARLASIKQGFT